MAIKDPIKLDLKNLPPYVKGVIAVLPSIIIAVAVTMLLIMPKKEEIKKFDKTIDTQNNKISESRAKVAKLDVLMKENEKLLARLNELKELLPEEKEVSVILKQLSDMSIASGLDVKSWKPKPKVKHPSGIVYELPSDVTVAGTYHDFGQFLSSLTKTNRILNVSSIRLGGPKKGKDPANNILDITFGISMFSSVPDAEAAAAAAKPAAKK